MKRGLHGEMHWLMMCLNLGKMTMHHQFYSNMSYRQVVVGNGTFTAAQLLAALALLTLGTLLALTGLVTLKKIIFCIYILNIQLL